MKKIYKGQLALRVKELEAANELLVADNKRLMFANGMVLKERRDITGATYKALVEAAEQADTLRAQVATLTHDLANEREKVERLREQVNFDCSNPVLGPCPDIAEFRTDRDKYKAALERIVECTDMYKHAKGTMAGVYHLAAEAVQS